MNYAKAVVAALGGVLQVLVPIMADNVITMSEWSQITAQALLAVGTIIAVFQIPNKPPVRTL